MVKKKEEEEKEKRKEKVRVRVMVGEIKIYFAKHFCNQVYWSVL